MYYSDNDTSKPSNDGIMLDAEAKSKSQTTTTKTKISSKDPENVEVGLLKVDDGSDSSDSSDNNVLDDSDSDSDSAKASDTSYYSDRNSLSKNDDTNEMDTNMDVTVSTDASILNGKYVASDRKKNIPMGDKAKKTGKTKGQSKSTTLTVKKT